jgi:hypothetical protein
MPGQSGQVSGIARDRRVLSITAGRDPCRCRVMIRPPGLQHGPALFGVVPNIRRLEQAQPLGLPRSDRVFQFRYRGSDFVYREYVESYVRKNRASSVLLLSIRICPTCPPRKEIALPHREPPRYPIP